MSATIIRKWWVLFTMCLLTLMFNFDVTAVNLAIPEISQEFHANLVNMQWVINAFVLLSAMFQILGGRAGDMWGHRRIFIVGTIIFVLASIFAASAHNNLMLIMARVFQGFSIGIAYPMTILLVYDAFPLEEQPVALGWIMGTMGIALAIGPTLGGLIVHYIGWRWIFWVNAPIGALAIALTFWFCRKDAVKEQQKIDYKGAALLMLGLLGIILALNQLQQWGFRFVPFWLVFLGGLLFLAILYFVERRKANPIIDFNLFSIKNYTLYNLIRIVSQVVFVPILFFIPVYLQNISGYSVLSAGLIMLYLTVVVGVLSPIAGKWTAKWGAKSLTMISMIAFAIACFLLMLIGAQPNHFILAAALILVGIGTGISFVSTTAGALAEVSPEKRGVAMGIFLTVAFASCALGVALLGTLIAMNAQSWLTAALTKGNILLSAVQAQELERVAHGVASPAALQGVVSPELLPTVSDLGKAAFMHGFHIAMLVFALISVLGLILTFVTRQVNFDSRSTDIRAASGLFE